MAATAIIDSKGRLSIPREVRDALGLKPGAVCFFNLTDGGFEVREADNPFDVLARKAREEYRAGQTVSLRDYAAEHGIDLNDE